MSFHPVKGKGGIIKQGVMEAYSLDISYSIPEYNLDFEGFLSKPKGNLNAPQDSFTEVLRSLCYQFCENHELQARKVDNEEWKPMIGEALYGTIMRLIINSVNTIDDRGDSLFVVKVSDTKLRKVKAKRKGVKDEMDKMDKEIGQLDIELAKKKAIAEIKRQQLGVTAIEIATEPVVEKQKTPVVETPVKEKKKTTKKSRSRKQMLEDAEADNLDFI